jgi:hypothetical protein|eukprot:COSAG01_NODE_10793_length_2079_cov_2.322727_2_plen_73_part_00
MVWHAIATGWMVLDRDDPSHVIQRSTGTRWLTSLHSLLGGGSPLISSLPLITRHNLDTRSRTNPLRAARKYT